MRSLANYLDDDRRLIPASSPVIHHSLLTELCTELFQTLPRRDQRRKAAEYVYGLLAADGRKSIRNIAALFGGQPAEQSLHHFICSSTWDWAPVRHALSRFVVRAAPPQAWVIRPMIIPKAGEHSVGVDRQFFSDIGHMLNAQQAVGLWAASGELRSPVNWRLHLSPAWLDDKRRRVRAAIPDGMGGESMGDCTVDVFLELMAGCELPNRPVVLDARDLDIPNVVSRLRAARVPLLARIGGTARLTVTDPALTGYHADVLPAHHIMRAARHLRRPAMWHTSLVAGVRVRMPREVPPSPQQGDLLLIATAKIGESWPAQLWLTNLTTADPAALLRLTRLLDSVDQDFADIADQVGVRDFAGRSFSGWHRHVTLASAAHAVSALTHRDDVAARHVA
jgi:hypothetical protein